MDDRQGYTNFIFAFAFAFANLNMFASKCQTKLDYHCIENALAFVDGLRER